jgi:hypothetical protein
VIAAILAAGVAGAALALWLALSLIPIAIGAAVIAWVAFRVGRWQRQRSRGVDVYRY